MTQIVVSGERIPVRDPETSTKGESWMTDCLSCPFVPKPFRLENDLGSLTNMASAKGQEHPIPVTHLTFVALWALCCSFYLLLPRMKLAVSKRLRSQAGSSLWGWTCLVILGKTPQKVRHPAGLIFTDCIFNYFHSASSPSGEEIKINLNRTVVVLGIRRNSSRHLVTAPCL